MRLKKSVYKCIYIATVTELKESTRIKSHSTGRDIKKDHQSANQGKKQIRESQRRGREKKKDEKIGES